MSTLNRRLHQQQLIYGGSGGMYPLRGIRSELLKHSDPPKKLVKENTSLNTPKSKTTLLNPLRNSASFSQRIPDSKTPPQRDLKPLVNPPKQPGSGPAKPNDGKGDASSKVVGKDNGFLGRTRQTRVPLIPPIQYPDKHVHRNQVTIDTSKARGNTDVVRLVARDLGWREFTAPRRDQNCDVTWHAIAFNDQPDIVSGQVNKFPGSLEVFHKVSLFRQLSLMKQLFPEHFRFFPRTWTLPAQMQDFISDARQMAEQRARGKSKPTFIIKPSEGSQGEGIYLLQDPTHYAFSGNRTHVAQEYLSHVLLLDGFKFDLRVYAVVRSLDPLEVHLCNEGLARFSTVPYEPPSQRNLHETFMHLTNYSLNKRNSAFVQSEREDEGSKRKMTAVLRLLQRMGHDTEALWKGIEAIVCKTLVAVAGELKIEQQAANPPGRPRPSCFQVLGFDILLTRDLEPVLLEVNSNPSLSITVEQEVAPGSGVYELVTCALDEDVKRTLVRDTLMLIAPKNKYTRKRRKRRRRKWHRQYSLEAEQMEFEPVVYSLPNGQTWHRNHRERDITICYTGESPTNVRQKSIFAENDKPRLIFPSRVDPSSAVQDQGEDMDAANSDNDESAQLANKDNSGPSVDKDESGPSADENKSASTADEAENQNNVNAIANAVPDKFPSKDSVLVAQSVGPEEEESEQLMEVDSQPPPFPEEEEEEEEEEGESSLKEILPGLYEEEVQPLRVCERLAAIFILSLGLKGCVRLGSTAFRTFARKSRLNRKGMNNASIDILYINMQRKWEFLNPERTSGLSFLGFVDACLEIGRRKFPGNSDAQTMEKLVTYCEETLKPRPTPALEEDSEDNNEYYTIKSPPFLRLPKPQRRPVTLFPRRTITSLEEEAPQETPKGRGSEPGANESNNCIQGVNNVMVGMRKRAYVPTAALVSLDYGGGDCSREAEENETLFRATVALPGYLHETMQNAICNLAAKLAPADDRRKGGKAQKASVSGQKRAHQRSPPSENALSCSWKLDRKT